MIKIDLRRNLRYPILFISFTFTRRGVKYIMEEWCLEGKSVSFLTVLFMIFFELILGLIYSCKNESPKKVKKEKTKMNQIKIIKIEKGIKRPDNLCKIISLMFFSGYFEFMGFLSRRLITIFNPNKKDYDEFNARYRSIEICFSSLLCFFTLRINIFRHQCFSLIIIIFSLIIVFVIEINYIDDHSEFLIDILIICGTSASRAFLDTIEKYLFDINFINIFKLIRFQSSINLILMSLLYFFKKPQNEIIELINLGKENFWKSFFSVFLLVVYGILSGYKNIYRRYTVKEYSPMSRSLAESIIDPFLIIFGYITDNKKIDFLYIFGITIFSLIMVFSSCVYNEVFVLYCCGLEYNAHLEIVKRAPMELAFNDARETNYENDNED